ncbi:hypothetical protein J5I95_23115 [Candidatus Poribacteria bacterium]|nr:hypothetical protein [Candidatus Poribacteria bacterium]
MLNNILSSRAIIAGLAFFVLMVASSLLYNWHVRHSSQKDADRTQQIVQQLQNSPSAETVQSTEQTGITLSVEKQDTAEDIYAAQDGIKIRTDDPQEEFSEEKMILETEAEIIAEEEMAKEALSAEELRIRELKRQQRDIFAQIKTLVAAKGRGAHSSTDPEKMHEVIQLQKELLSLQEEIDGNPNPAANFFLDLALMVNSSLNQNGELPVSESLKIVDYIEAGGDSETANRVRAVIQRAIASGDDVIKPEHVEGIK